MINHIKNLMVNKIVKTKTDLQIEYAFLSWNYEFPDRVETILENDFIEHAERYDENSMKRIEILLLINSNPSKDVILSNAQNSDLDVKSDD